MKEILREIEQETRQEEASPYYLASGDEEELFETAYRHKLPVMLKGPTGCGKTRFIRHMAHRLGRSVVTVACHDDLTSSDLVGRYLVKGGETLWVDGPLSHAVRIGAICYLDEIVEARQDTTVVIHPLTDDRRILPVEKTGETLHAPDAFMLVISFNPGYQSLLKDLKPSTKQRFVAMEFDYPEPTREAEIVAHETGVDGKTAGDLVLLAGKIRNLKDKGLEETVSTRLLVYAGQLIRGGIAPIRACETAMLLPITDEPEIKRGIKEIISSVF